MDMLPYKMIPHINFFDTNLIYIVACNSDCTRSLLPEIFPAFQWSNFPAIIFCGRIRRAPFILLQQCSTQRFVDILTWILLEVFDHDHSSGYRFSGVLCARTVCVTLCSNLHAIIGSFVIHVFDYWITRTAALGHFEIEKKSDQRRRRSILDPWIL